MKAIFLVLGLAVFFFGLYTGGWKEKNSLSDEAVIKHTLLEQVTGFDQFLKDTLLVAIEADAPLERVQQVFIRARSRYKRFEWAAEYFMPATTRFVNGAPLPEVEFEENKLKEPEGLQVLESLVFPEMQPQNKPEIIRQVNLLRANCIRYQDYFNSVDLTPSQIFDALKLQLVRIITLGISGFDTPLAESGIREAKESLGSIYLILQHYDKGQEKDKLFSSALHYLVTHDHVLSFDRLKFVTDYANPLSLYITRVQHKSGIPLVRDVRLLRPEAGTLFDKDAFDVNAYVPDSSYYVSDKKIRLGSLLFNNTLLSGNNERSCASCHQPGRSFTDGLVKSKSLDGRGFIRRNTPTLLYAALQPAQFYDLRATILENQAMEVVRSRDEMHGSMIDAAIMLGKNEKYRKLFAETFPDAGHAVKPWHIQNALASYIRSLTAMNSRFDQYMRGDTTRLNAREKDGFNLFMGKAKCGTCHFMPLFNGTVPPSFLKIETEVIGVPDKSMKNIDPDQGRYDLGRLEPFMHAFKTPTVRNIALTAPYMHNGVFDTLEEVVDFYNKGGGAGLGINVINQTLPFEKLNLTKYEETAVVAFMKSLTDLKN